MPKVFYRNPMHDYPLVVRGEGVYLYDADGNDMVMKRHPYLHQFRVVCHHILDIQRSAQERSDFIQLIRPVIRF